MDYNYFSSKNLTYLEENNIIFGGLSITDYDASCGTDVVIPKTINGNSVTTIGEDAFYGNQLTSVTIPNSVRIIYGASFFSNNITEVTIPDAVEILSCDAFDGDTIINKRDSLVCNNSCQYKPC